MNNMKNSNQEIEIIKKNQKEIPKLKNTVTEMKIHLDGYTISFEQAEESIIKPDDRKLKLSCLRNRKKKE